MTDEREEPVPYWLESAAPFDPQARPPNMPPTARWPFPPINRALLDAIDWSKVPIPPAAPPWFPSSPPSIKPAPAAEHLDSGNYWGAAPALPGTTPTPLSTGGILGSLGRRQYGDREPPAWPQARNAFDASAPRPFERGLVQDALHAGAATIARQKKIPPRVPASNIDADRYYLAPVPRAPAWDQVAPVATPLSPSPSLPSPTSWGGARASFTDYLRRAITDVHKEGSQAVFDALHGINQNLNPFSSEYANQPQLGGGFGADLADQFRRFRNTGSGLASVAALPFAYPAGAARSLLGHPLASALEFTERVINPQTAESHEEIYDKIKNDIDLALMALGPRGARVGPRSNPWRGSPGAGVPPRTPAAQFEPAPATLSAAPRELPALNEGVEIPAHGSPAPVPKGYQGRWSDAVDWMRLVPQPMASRSADMLDPPATALRPFAQDYPRGAPAGPLTYDIEGRPLIAEYVVGRQVAGGADEAFPTSGLDDLAEGITFEPTRTRTKNELGGDLGRSYVDPVTGRPMGIALQSHLKPDLRRMVYRHEIGHAIDDMASQIPTDGLLDELKVVYDALNQPVRARGRHDPGPVADPLTPESFGYAGDDVMREYMAEAIRAYLTNPNYLKTVAPNTAAAIRGAVNAHPTLRPIIQFNTLPALKDVAAAPGAGGVPGSMG